MAHPHPDGVPVTLVTPLSRLGLPLQAAILASGTFVATLLGIWLTRANDDIGAIWFANAVMLAVLLAARQRDLPVLLATAAAAVLAANLVAGEALDRAMVAAVTDLLEAAVGAQILWRHRAQLDLSRRREVVVFGLVVGVVGPGVGVGTHALALLALDAMPPLPILINDFAAHAIGALILGALVFAPFEGADLRTEIARLRSRASALLLTLLVATASYLFWQEHYPLLFLVVPVIVVCAVELGMLGAALSVVILAVVSIGFTVAEHGPLVTVTDVLHDRVSFMQLFLPTFPK